MLTSLGVRNFKPFGDTLSKVDFGRVTIFIGENGTGKSSLLQSLALLKQSCGMPQLRPGSFKFASFGDLVHKGETRRQITISFAGTTVEHAANIDQAISLRYEAEFTDPGNLAGHVGEMTGIGPLLGLKTDSLRAEFRHGDGHVVPNKISDDTVFLNVGASNKICLPFSSNGGGWTEEQYKKRYYFLEPLVQHLENVFTDCLAKVSIDWAGRGFDAQSYTLQKEPSSAPATGEEVYSTFAYRRELEEKVSDWLRKITGTGVSVHIVPGHQVQLRNSEGFDIYQGGFGSNQLIRPLLRIAASPSDSLIAIEEVETSLHPRAQTNLCDVLLELVKKEEKQIVLTVHGEHMVTGFLNLVAEGKLSPEEFKVYYFSKQAGEASITPLKVDSKGGIEDGLKGFFEVDLEGYERHLKALRRRGARA